MNSGRGWKFYHVQTEISEFLGVGSWAICPFAGMSFAEVTQASERLQKINAKNDSREGAKPRRRILKI